MSTMIAAQQNASPIIPVTDERLEHHPKGNKEHKDKVARHNELLEDIYERKMELVKMEEALAEMREEIVDESHVLAGTERPEEAEKVEGVEGAEQILSDSGSEKSSEKVDKRKKTKAKGARRERVKVDSEMDSWDYRLDLASSNKGERRASDTSDMEEADETEVDAVPDRNSVGIVHN